METEPPTAANDQAVGPPEVLETHISTVFLARDRAYKLLKPLATAFLDHRSADARLEAIDRELEFNRRLAPDVYLGTADVTEHGQVVDRMLVMKRLPHDRRLSLQVSTAGFDDELRAVTRAIATFHCGLPPVRGAAASMATADVVREHWESSFEDIEPSVGPVIDAAEFDAVRTMARDYLTTSAALFDQRITDGWIRDGHGDLTAEDIFCLPDGPRIIDCLAFDPELRIGDVLADISFLAMDIHRLAGPEAASRLMAWYAEFTNEHHPPSLAHFYVAYRAHVRAKIECLRHAQGVPQAAAAARVYHHLAAHHLDRARVRLVLVGGGPGVGKSTVARGIAERTGWSLLDSDELRKDLVGVDHLHDDVAEPGEGIYTPEMTDAVYATLVDHAEALLVQGRSVVLDASWNKAVHRLRAEEMARRHGVAVIELQCQVDPGLARERVARRLAAGSDPSDATPAVVDHLIGQHDPWPSAIVLDTSSTPRPTIDEAIGRVCDFGPELDAGVRSGV
ncbi:MAG: AAA family ATPase [Acidimicrobiia bacterium]|nr:AAA family ATPase [Acidimicrobiia bacterium]